MGPDTTVSICLRIKEATLSLTIRAYQYDLEDCVDDIWDPNWLFIGVALTRRDAIWRGIAPALIVHDLVTLATWFDSASRGAEVPYLRFLEPYLSL